MPACDLSSKAAQRRTLAALPPGAFAALYLGALGWHRRTRGEAATRALLGRTAKAAAKHPPFPLSPAQAAAVALLRGCRLGDDREAYQRWRGHLTELYEAARRGRLDPSEPAWPKQKKAS